MRHQVPWLAAVEAVSASAELWLEMASGSALALGARQPRVPQALGQTQCLLGCLSLPQISCLVVVASEQSGSHSVPLASTSFP